MKTTQNNSSRFTRPAFRLPSLVALVLCAGVSARASLASLQTLDQSLSAQQNQLSTGLQINTGAGDINANNPYSWLEAAPGVFSLNYNSLQQASQQQQVLQLLQTGDSSLSQSAISTLQIANQSPQSVLQLFNDNSAPAIQSQAQALSAQSSTPVQSQEILKLLNAGDDAAELATLQQASASQSLSLANQSLQTSVSTLQQADSLPSVQNLVQANQLNQLSTGLRINQAADPALLTVSTQNGLVVQLSQQNDGYDNKQGLNADGLSVNNVSLQALFTDAASLAALQTPLSASDFQSVGQLNQQQALNFFQLAQSVNGNTLQLLGQNSEPGVGDTFSTSVVALKNLNSPYLFVSIADQSGLDAQDYNGAVLAINIGAANVHALLAAPEPSLYLTLGGFLALALWAKRRLDRVEAVNVK